MPEEKTGYSANPQFESVQTQDVLNDIGDSKIQAAYDGLVVPVGDGLGMSDAIDPTATSSPLGDAFAALSGGGSVAQGTVLLPAGVTLQEDPNLSVPGRLNIIGVGQENSVVEFQAGTGDDGLQFDASARGLTALSDIYVDRVTFTGPGNATDHGVLWHFVDGNTNDLHLGQVNFANWGGAVMYAPSSVQVFRSHFGKLSALNIDNGGGGAIINFESGGPHNTADTIKIAADDSRTAADSRAVKFSGGVWSIGTLGAVGTVDRTLTVGNDNTVVSIDVLFAESTGQNTTTGEVALLSDRARTRIGQTRVQNGTFDYVYNCFFSPGNKNLGTVKVVNGTINNNTVNVADGGGSGVTAPIHYEGPHEDIDEGSNFSNTDAKDIYPSESRGYPYSQQSIQLTVGGTVTQGLQVGPSDVDDLSPADINIRIGNDGSISADYGYSIDSVFHDDSAGEWAVRIAETENAAATKPFVEVTAFAK